MAVPYCKLTAFTNCVSYCFQTKELLNYRLNLQFDGECYRNNPFYVISQCEIMDDIKGGLENRRANKNMLIDFTLTPAGGSLCHLKELSTVGKIPSTNYKNTNQNNA